MSDTAPVRPSVRPSRALLAALVASTGTSSTRRSNNPDGARADESSRNQVRRRSCGGSSTPKRGGVVPCSGDPSPLGHTRARGRALASQASNNERRYRQRDHVGQTLQPERSSRTVLHPVDTIALHVKVDSVHVDFRVQRRQNEIGLRATLLPCVAAGGEHLLQI